MAAALMREGPHPLPNATADFYVSTGVITTLRDWMVCNEDSSAHQLTVSVGTDGAGKRLYRLVTIDPHSTLQLSGSVVLLSGDKIQAYADTANVLTLTVSGVTQ